MNDHERLEAWLDGRLSPAAQADFQARIARDSGLRARVRLQRGVDAALRRGFRPPEALAERLAAGLAGSARPGSAPVTLRRTLAVAAAALLVTTPLLLLVRGRGEAGRVERAVPGAVASLSPAERPDRVRTPDLESLYQEVADRPLTAESCASLGEPRRNDLHRTIVARYGAGIAVDPEAETLLDGPFIASEWPSGTVLAGLPDGPAGPPAVLIAEHESEARCCLRLNPPADGELKVFTWRVGDVFLTEVTPREEPRLLQLFHAP